MSDPSSPRAMYLRLDLCYRWAQKLRDHKLMLWCAAKMERGFSAWAR